MSRKHRTPAGRVIVADRVRLFPSHVDNIELKFETDEPCRKVSQAGWLGLTCGAVRFAFNKILGEAIQRRKVWAEWYESHPNEEPTDDDKQNLPDISEYGLGRWFTSRKKKDYQWLKDYHGNIGACAAHQVADAYTRMKTQGAGKPQFKKKNKSWDSITINDSKKIYLTENTLTLKTAYHTEVIRLSRTPRYPVNDARRITITHEPDDTYYVSITFEVDESLIRDMLKLRGLKEQLKHDPELNARFKSTGATPGSACAIDWNFNNITMADDAGNIIVFIAPQALKQNLYKLTRLQRKQSACEKDSNQYTEYKHKIAKLNKKIRCQREDWNQKVSSFLIANYDTIMIEGLEPNTMFNEWRGHNRAVMDNAFGSLRDMLRYKTRQTTSGVLMSADRWFPSSQLCSECGAISKNTTDEREFDCWCCGEHLHRDENAALNLLRLLMLQVVVNPVRFNPVEVVSKRKQAMYNTAVWNN